MKHTAMTQPAKSTLAKRNGGNGGYSKKAAVPDKPMVRRAYNLRDFHGKKYEAKV